MPEIHRLAEKENLINTFETGPKTFAPYRPINVHSSAVPNAAGGED